MRERTAWILSGATVAASIGASAVVVSVLAPSAREEAGSASLDGALLRELTGELARLRSAIDDLERRTELAPARPVDETRRPAGPTDLTGEELERLVSAIEHLEITLRDEHAATRGALASNGQAAALPSRPTTIDWPAWQELWGIYQGDPKAAAEEVRLLTSDQLLQRYGPPTAMRGREDGSRMWYYYDESAGGEPLSVTLRLLDGYVTDVWMEL